MSDLHKKTWYRPDIDGLRAVAVVAVIFFHAKVPGFAGGYVGVDVFFVISGFLITGIIVRQLQQGTFSLSQFWQRRIRRIIPALTVVLLATAVAGYWLILFPLDYLDFGQSLFAQAFFLSNIFFLRKSDYFAGPAEDSPLLHVWSLAIEEQFYLLFPIGLLLLWKLGRRVVVFVLSVLLLASVVWSQLLLMQGDAAFSVPFFPAIWAAADNATAAFYLLPARAYELLIGAVLALMVVRLPTRWLAEISAIAGIGFIGWSIFTFTDTTLFPGVSALLPTLGTALLLLAHTGHTTMVGSVLARPSLVWIGLLSYSLYLWHWPVLVLGKYWLAVEVLDVIQVFALLTLTTVLSVGTYYLVETPVRNWRLDSPAWQVFMAGLVSLVLLAGIGYVIMFKDGLPERSPEVARQIALGATDFGPDRTRCFVESQACQFGDTEKVVTHLVLGDSHGGALLPAIAAAAEQTGTSVQTYLSPGCSPLTALATEKSGSTCDTIHKKALKQIETGNIKSVLLVSRWSNYKTLATDQLEAQKLFETYVTDTVEALTSADIEVFVLLQVPNHKYFETRKAFYEAIETTKLPDYFLPRSVYDEQRTVTADVFTTLVKADLVTTLDPLPYFCNDTECDLVRDGVMLYQDSNHVSQTGSMLMLPLMLKFLTSQ